MSERPSLMEQAGITEPAPTAKPAKSPDAAKTAKLAAAGALLVVAAGVLAWSTGLIGGSKAPKVDPKVAQERKERFEKQVEEDKARDAEMGVTPVESGG